MRECCIFLYDQWFHLSEQRYQHLKEEMSHLYLEGEGAMVVETQKEENKGPKDENINSMNQEIPVVLAEEMKKEENGEEPKETLIHENVLNEKKVE